MLILGSKLLDYPILSLHMGGEIARTDSAIINPDGLKVIAYTISGPVTRDPEIGNVLDITDVREFSSRGLIVDSTDNFTNRSDVIRLDQVMSLNFNLIGLKVFTEDGKKLGKVTDYTVDSGSFIIYQIIVARSAIRALLDPELTINRSQITEIDDYQITVKSTEQTVKIAKENPAENFVPNFVNPFRQAGAELKDHD